MAFHGQAFTAPFCVLWKLRRIAQLTSLLSRVKSRMEVPLLQPHERTALLSEPPPPPPPPPPLFNRATSEADDEGGSKFNLASMYMKLLHSRPLLTKVVTSALISAISDLIAQAIEGTDKIDVMRNVAFLLAGAILTAPMFHVAYELFEHVIPATKVRNVVLQVLGDQLIVAPFWLVLFFPFIAMVEGESDVHKLMNALRRQFVPALKVTWILFPAVQVVNFSVVPKHLRVLVVNVCDLVYTAILSWLAHGHEQQRAQS